METLQTWLQGTFDCLLPCWGGITPGITTWQEAKRILEQLSGFASVNSAENMSCSFGQCHGVGWSLYPDTVAEGFFYAKPSNNIIHVISMDIRNEGDNKSNLLRNIRLRDIFGWYGVPALLLLNAGPELEGNKFLELFMVYPERQFVIQYFKKAEVTGDRVISCQDDSRIRLIVLDNKEQLASLDAIASAVETRDLRVGAGHKSVEEAMGMTVHAFYVAYGQRDEPCISTPVNVWVP